MSFIPNNKTPWYGGIAAQFIFSRLLDLAFGMSNIRAASLPPQRTSDDFRADVSPSNNFYLLYCAA